MATQVFDNVPAWGNSVVYNYNDVVIYNDHYYFCLLGNQNNQPDISTTYWSNETTFNWAASYGTEIDIDTPITQVNYGDNYNQRYPKGLGTVRFKPFSLRFDQIDDAQANAMSIFLSNPNNNKFFTYLVPFPHNRLINVICVDWTISKIFDNNHTLTASFEEYLGYEYQPQFVFSSSTNPNSPTEQTIYFLANSVLDNETHYITARGSFYADTSANLYSGVSGDLIFPYLNNGLFVSKNGACYSAVLKGAIDNTFLSSTGIYYTTATGIYNSLTGQGLISTISGETINGYYLDGKVAYVRVLTDKIADPNSDDPTEVSSINSLTTLQFFPFQSQYDNDRSLYTGYKLSHALHNKWAVMPLTNAMNMWWSAYYFSVLTPYGGATAIVNNQSGLGLFQPKTFFANGFTPGGYVNGYCWLSSGYVQYSSQVSGLDGNSFFTGIIPRSVLQSGAVIYAQIEIPVCSQLAMGTGTGILGTTFQGTYYLNSGSGNAYGNPDRGLSSITFDNSSNSTCIKGPNYWNFSGNNPIQFFPYPNNVFSGLSGVPNEGVIFDGNKTMCMCTTPSNYNMINEIISINSGYAIINSGYLISNTGQYYQLTYSGIPTGGNTNNSCGLQVI